MFELLLSLEQFTFVASALLCSLWLRRVLSLEFRLGLLKAAAVPCFTSGLLVSVA